MEIMCVGIPKSGTNLLEKAIRGLGCDAGHHVHTSDWRLAERRKVAYIYRNPRDVLVSAARYCGEQRRGGIEGDVLLKTFWDFFNCGLPWVYRSYGGWMRSCAHVVRFEELAGLRGVERQGVVVDGMAEWLGVGKRRLDLVGGTATWTGRLSDWREVWTEGVDRVWVEEGMVEIERGLGYEEG